jgi:hypothetical protein
MVSEFYIGDKVRRLSDGTTHTVTSFSPCGVFVRVDGEVAGHFLSYYEKVERAFCLSTATDQELADEYRRLLDLRKPLYDALISKGYVLCDGKGIGMTRNAIGSEVRITKTVKETITL